MKVSTKQSTSFNSITLEIKIESREELNFFGTLFNHTAIHRAAASFGCPKLDEELESIYELLQSHGADIHQVNKFTL